MASTTYFDEATISSSLQNCTLRNGWCVTVPSLALTSNEPVPGYQIQAIEGNLNGELFACVGANCSVPLVEGANDFQFWAHSSFGDTSQKGILSANVDTRPPVIIGSLTGVPGENGWFISDVNLSALAEDPTPGSGLANMTYAVDGASPIAFSGSLNISDGIHVTLLTATDAAGHMTSATQTISVDTQPPVSAFTTSAPALGWVRGTLALAGTSSDATSGVAAVVLSVDGANWQPLVGTSSWEYAWDTTSILDGPYTILARALDLAGNQGGTASLSVSVDNTPPALVLTTAGSYCPDCGGSLSVDLSVQDASSGIGGWTLNVDGATALTGGTASTTQTFSWNGSGLGLGTHTLTLSATDMVGSRSEVSVTVTLVDAPPPPAPPVSDVTIPSASNPPAVPLPTNVPPVATARPALPTSVSTIPPLVIPFKDDQDTAASVKDTASSTVATSPILWAAAAAGLIGAVSAYAADTRRRREQEEEQQAAAAAAFNAANRLVRREDEVRQVMEMVPEVPPVKTDRAEGKPSSKRRTSSPQKPGGAAKPPMTAPSRPVAVSAQTSIASTDNPKVDKFQPRMQILLPSDLVPRRVEIPQFITAQDPWSNLITGLSINVPVADLWASSPSGAILVPSGNNIGLVSSGNFALPSLSRGNLIRPPVVFHPFDPPPPGHNPRTYYDSDGFGHVTSVRRSARSPISVFARVPIVDEEGYCNGVRGIRSGGTLDLMIAEDFNTLRSFRGAARDYYETYMVLKYNSGPWNGGQVGTLTFLDFVEMCLNVEFQNFPGSTENHTAITDRTLVETVIRNFYTFVPYRSGFDGNASTTDPHDVFLWLAGKHMLSGAGREMLLDWGSIPSHAEVSFNNWTNPYGIWNDINFSYWFNHYSEQFPEWEFQNNNRPYDWANRSMIDYLIENRGLNGPRIDAFPGEPGTGFYQVFYRAGAGDYFYILTPNQAWYWYNPGDIYIPSE